MAGRDMPLASSVSLLSGRYWLRFVGAFSCRSCCCPLLAWFPVRLPTEEAKRLLRLLCPREWVESWPLP